MDVIFEYRYDPEGKPYLDVWPIASEQGIVEMLSLPIPPSALHFFFGRVETPEVMI